MVRSLVACFVLLSGATLAFAQQPFLSSEQWVKLRDEASGAAPYENLRYLTGLIFECSKPNPLPQPD